jgi:hypothetical protein
MKTADATSSAYVIAPKGGTTFEDFIKDSRSALCLRKDKEGRVIYGYQLETAKSDASFEIAESLEKTAIAGVLRSKFLCSNPESYKRVWTVKEINEMTTRELISAVFQSLSEKLKG